MFFPIYRPKKKKKQNKKTFDSICTIKLAYPVEDLNHPFLCLPPPLQDRISAESLEW